MIQPIVHDALLLARPSRKAEASDVPTADDLLDTLRAHAQECVGMAANMIGVPVRIIVFDCDGSYLEMFNPEILSGKDRYDTEEGCLSLSGVRPCTRFRTVRVRWQDRQMRTRIRNFSGFSAEIIQHEVDHCNGILI